MQRIAATMTIPTWHILAFSNWPHRPASATSHHRANRQSGAASHPDSADQRWRLPLTRPHPTTAARKGRRTAAFGDAFGTSDEKVLLKICAGFLSGLAFGAVIGAVAVAPMTLLFSFTLFTGDVAFDYVLGRMLA